MGCPPPLDAVSSEQVHSSSICPCASIRQVDSLRLSEDHPPSVRIFAYFHAHSGVSVGFLRPVRDPAAAARHPFLRFAANQISEYGGTMSEIIVTLKGGIEIGPVKIYAQTCLQAPAE